MYTKLEHFIAEWEEEARLTERVLNALTDESLSAAVAPGRRTAGRIAWHLASSIHYLSYCGLDFEGPSDADGVPSSAAEIAEAYRRASDALIRAVRTQWTDDKLEDMLDMMGVKWSIGKTLRFTVMHQAHHRGQLTVLMRQAGLRIPEVYGQTYDSWVEQGTDPLP